MSMDFALVRNLLHVGFIPNVGGPSYKYVVVLILGAYISMKCIEKVFKQ